MMRYVISAVVVVLVVLVLMPTIVTVGKRLRRYFKSSLRG